MAEFPALPLFTDAILGDTQHLSQAEFGAYMLMLIVAWRSPSCSLPNDDQYLARITRSTRNWHQIKPAVMSFWKLGEDNQLRQKRLSYEHLAARELRAQRSEAGKSSAQKRKERLSTVVQAVLQRGSYENSTPYPNPNSSTIQEKDANASSSVARAPAPDDLIEAVTIWNQMAARNGLAQVQKLTDQRKTKLRARLNDCGGIEGWAVACSKVDGNAFLTGQIGDWKADFDFMLQQKSFTKLMEGGYDRNKSRKTDGATGFAALLAEDWSPAEN